MKIEIKPYTEDLAPALHEFNHRMRAARNRPRVWRLKPVSLPQIQGRRIYQERFVALDGSCVRGGYLLTWQEVSFRSEILRMASFVEPISEGSIDTRYALVGIALAKDALQRAPLLFGLGIGGEDRPLAKILGAMGWSMRSVPFYFKVRNASAFLRNVQPIRKTRFAAFAMDALSVSGLGWLALAILRAVLGVKRRVVRCPAVEVVEEFSEWADELWEACHTGYSMIAVRDAHVLNIVYPPQSEKFLRLKITEGGRVLGWAVVSDAQRADLWRFGGMRVGAIMDCLGLPEHAGAVIRGATQVLEQKGVDLIVCNQSHPAWRTGLRDAGFFRGMSDCIFAASRLLAEKLSSIDPQWAQIYVNRDGRPR